MPGLGKDRLPHPRDRGTGVELRRFTKRRNRPTLRGPHLDNLTFNFKGATRRSAPFRFTSPCLKCDPLAVVAITSTFPQPSSRYAQPAALSCSECGRWGRSFCAGTWGHSLSRFWCKGNRLLCTRMWSARRYCRIFGALQTPWAKKGKYEYCYYHGIISTFQVNRHNGKYAH